MSPLPLRRQIGQLLIAGFKGTDVPVELRALAAEFDLGGVILFKRNVSEPGQVAELAVQARALGVERPAWVSIDQEGGRVARLRAPFTEWPPMAVLGRSGDPDLAERFGRALGAELRAVGISLDYAPVLDVQTNPANPVIGDRALADRADVAAGLGRRIIGALQAQGIAACGKHFPGHGDTATDSHLELPVVEHPPDRLRAVELVPFRAAVEADVAFIMTAHVLVTAFDDLHPATLSRPIVHGLLREELGFRGVVVTDDLDMKAIASRYTIGEAAVAALGAGCDALLVCGGDVDRQAAAIESVIHAVEAGTLPLARVEDALARQRRMKDCFLEATAGGPSRSPLAGDWRPQPPDVLRAVVGCDAHRALAAEMSAYA
jgi:beta-N-acetylhexosaminidase